jgi:Uma2 family endonuclease
MSLADHQTTRAPCRWSRAEYERMAEAGVLEAQTRMELIDGEILTMPPQSTRHFTAISLTERALSAIFSSGFDIRSQGPLAIDPHSEPEPEPDIAVVEGSVRDYTSAHPKSAVLLVEIADSGPGFDRVVKKRLYARNGIAEYWILDLNARSLEVYRDPAGDDYLSKQTIDRQGSVAALAAPTATVRVAELLP